MSPEQHGVERHLAWHGEVELLNARWELGVGRTVELGIAGDSLDRVHPFKRFQKARGGKMGTRFHVAIASSTSGEVRYDGQCMFWGWRDGPTGQSITLLLDDETYSHPFDGCQRRARGLPGEFFAAAFVELDDDEAPVDQAAREVVERAERQAKRRKPRTLSQQAHMMITGPQFLGYLRDLRDDPCVTADAAREYVRQTLGIESLSALDADPAVAAKFDAEIRRPFELWVN